MLSDNTVQMSEWLLASLGTQMFLHHGDRIPRQGAVLVVSNHRSFMDPIVLTAATGRTIRFACHHYMGQIPVMRDVVTALGAFPLEAPSHRQQHFFAQAMALLQAQQMVGIFPEGAEPMVQSTQANTLGKFQRGFAHLALRTPVRDLAVLPIALASYQEQCLPTGVPLRLLSLFDPSEPLFKQTGWHPVVIYQRLNVLIGRPYWITPFQRQQYQGKQVKTAVADLTHYCQAEIAGLLRQGCF